MHDDMIQGLQQLLPYEKEGIALMRKMKPDELALYSDNLLCAAYRRYCNIHNSAGWLAVTPCVVEDFYQWAFSTNMKLMQLEVES